MPIEIWAPATGLSPWPFSSSQNGTQTFSIWGTHLCYVREGKELEEGVKGQSPFLSRGRACAAGGQSTTAQGPLDIPRWLKSPFFPGANGDGWGKLSGDKTAFKGKRPLEVQKWENRDLNIDSTDDFFFFLIGFICLEIFWLKSDSRCMYSFLHFKSNIRFAKRRKRKAPITLSSRDKFSLPLVVYPSGPLFNTHTCKDMYFTKVGL